MEDDCEGEQIGFVVDLVLCVFVEELGRSVSVLLLADVDQIVASLVELIERPLITQKLRVYKFEFALAVSGNAPRVNIEESLALLGKFAYKLNEGLDE